MLELDGRVLRAAWTVFVFVLVVALIYLTRSVLVIFTLAIFLAHLIAPWSIGSTASRHGAYAAPQSLRSSTSR